MMQNEDYRLFFATLRSGLWEQNCRLASFEPIDFATLYEVADEQSVVGLVAAGLEHVEDRKITKKDALPFMKKVFGIEGRNASMNSFINSIVRRMRDSGIHLVLIKGQGVAQCYERPQWRSAGDIDLFLDEENYLKAKCFLTPLASHVDGEDESRLHLGMTIDSWTVELHGTMRSELSSKIDRVIDDVQRDIFRENGIRIWRNDSEDIFLPNPDNDVILVFTHFIHHFYVGGIGLRQISDWCRLLWAYRDTIDKELLRTRLMDMDLMTEWNAFAAFVVEWLGMPNDVMPFYSTDNSFRNKAYRLCNLIMESGNFGKKKDSSYRSKYPKLIRNAITLWRRFGEFVRIAIIFPGNAPKFFMEYLRGRLRSCCS